MVSGCRISAHSTAHKERTTPMLGIPSSRCQASLSAEVYRRKSKAAGTYDHSLWLRYDGNHVRCENPSRMMRRDSTGWVGLCRLHDAAAKKRGQYFPYIPPGRGCQEPCCRPAGMPRTDAGASVWQIGTWTPSRRLRPSDETAEAKRERLGALFRKAAATSLWALDLPDRDPSDDEAAR
jgi:hypothetical protein